MSDFSQQDHWSRVALELGLTPPEDSAPKTERVEERTEPSPPPAPAEGVAAPPTEALPFRVKEQPQAAPAYPPELPPKMPSAARPVQAVPSSGATRPGNHWRQLAEQLGVELPPEPPPVLPPELGPEPQAASVSDQSLPSEKPTEEFPDRPSSDEKKSFQLARPQGQPSEPPRPKAARAVPPEGKSSWGSGQVDSERRKTKRSRKRRREKQEDRPIRHKPEFSSFPKSSPPPMASPSPTEFAQGLEEKRPGGEVLDAFQAGEERFSLARESAGPGSPEGCPPAGVEESPPFGLETRKEVSGETEAAADAASSLLPEIGAPTPSPSESGQASLADSLTEPYGMAEVSPAAEDFREPLAPSFLEPEEILEPEDLFEPSDLQEAQEEYELAAEESETPAGRESEEEKELHRGVPTWKEVMDLILSTNREARSRRGDRGGPGRPGRGGHH